MHTLNAVLRLTGVELLKLRSKPVSSVTLLMLSVGPVVGELSLAAIARDDALFPRAVLLAGELLLIVALMSILVSVMALGNDYELGTVCAFVSRGIDRYQFVLSKVLATVVAAVAYGSAYVSSALMATTVGHITLSDVSLAQAAGPHLLRRALGAVGVIGLTSFVFTSVVMLALVVGRHSWVGMLAGLGTFMADFYVGVLSISEMPAHRYAVTHHARSLLERCFKGATTGMRMSGTLAMHGPVEPGLALAVLLLYGCGFTLAAILIFRHQDLTIRTA
jgi:ABC-type transport system involved in multi-copper enzyme maturation permease subunit